jgi:hypothetical protein
MLNVIRAVKFWQRRPTMPKMESYLLECVMVDHFASKWSETYEFVDLELEHAFRHVAQAVLGVVSDPKRIQSDLNDLSVADRISIHTRALYDADRARDARAFEVAKQMKASIDLWGDIFGPTFPKFG